MTTIKTIERSYKECYDLLPEDVDFNATIPNAQLSVMHYLVKIHWKKLIAGFRKSKKLNKEAKFGLFALLFLCASRAYLQTQYYYTKRLKPEHVDLEELKRKWSENSGFNLKLFLPNDLDYLLTKVWKHSEEDTLEVMKKLDVILKTSDEKNVIRSTHVVCAVIGAIMWQLVESISTRKTAAKLAPKVFISYSTKDKSVVDKIEKKLNDHGIDTWRDIKDIKIGEPLLDKIQTGIWKECDFILFILSANSKNSGWFKTELRMAYEKEIESNEVSVLALLIDDCSVPKELSIKKYLRLNDGFARSMNELIEGIMLHSSFRRIKTANKKR